MSGIVFIKISICAALASIAAFLGVGAYAQTVSFRASAEIESKYDVKATGPSVSYDYLLSNNAARPVTITLAAGRRSGSNNPACRV
jgi:hypothetical protein